MSILNNQTYQWNWPVLLDCITLNYTVLETVNVANFQLQFSRKTEVFRSEEKRGWQLIWMRNIQILNRHKHAKPKLIYKVPGIENR